MSPKNRKQNMPNKLPKKLAKKNRYEKCCEKKSVRKIPILKGICYIEVEPPTYFVNYGLSPNSAKKKSVSVRYKEWPKTGNTITVVVFVVKP
jgi:hypothetical protein